MSERMWQSLGEFIASLESEGLSISVHVFHAPDAEVDEKMCKFPSAFEVGDGSVNGTIWTSVATREHGFFGFNGVDITMFRNKPRKVKKGGEKIK